MKAQSERISREGKPEFLNIVEKLLNNIKYYIPYYGETLEYNMNIKEYFSYNLNAEMMIENGLIKVDIDYQKGIVRIAQGVLL
jgi:hypothetical protein